jgi:hypothetical protein
MEVPVSSFFDKAKAVAGSAAAKAKEGVEEVQEKRERSQLITQLGNDALDLLGKGEISHPTLEATAAKIRQLDADDAEPDSAPSPGEAAPPSP